MRALWIFKKSEPARAGNKDRRPLGGEYIGGVRLIDLDRCSKLISVYKRLLRTLY